MSDGNLPSQQILPGVDLSLNALVEDSVELLRICEPDRSYHGCFSGGKDSCVIKELAKQAGVKVEWHYHVTTIDPPELVYFIRRQHPDVIFDRPECNFFTFAIRHRKGFPTRRVRWCCEHFKERKSPKGAHLILGIRAAESPRRKKNWKEVTANWRTAGYMVSPNVWNMRHGTDQRDGRVWFGDRYFTNWQEMWEWWLSDEPLPTDDCQGIRELFV